jgi:hypothetical protein
MKFWVILAVALIVRYLVLCWLWPFRDCWVCRGAGRHRRARNRKLSRRCWRCRGAGVRLRLGRRAVNWVILRYRDAYKAGAKR